jgi:hypothetical protein
MKALLRAATVFSVVITSVCAGAAPTTTRSTTRPSTLLLTQGEIRALLEQKKYDKVVPAVNAALAVKGAKAADYDRYVLLMLKGDAQLGLAQFKSARDAFAAAGDATKDESKAATARATIRLLIEVKGPSADQKLSMRGAKPRDPALLDVDKRDEALKSLRDEIRVIAKRRLDAAKTAKTIPPIMDALDSLALKYDLELATGGKGEDDRAAFTELSGVARDRMRKELDRMRDVVSKIVEQATEIVGTSGPQQTPIYRGISDPERTDLATMADTNARIVRTTALLARGAGADAEVDKQLVSDGKELAKYIRSLQRMPSNTASRQTPPANMRARR